MNCKSTVFFFVLAVCVFVASCVPVLDDGQGEAQGKYKLLHW